MGRRLALAPEQINRLIAAALTAKLALLPYQDKLNNLKTALTPEQRAIIDKHPMRTVEALQTADIDDPLGRQIILPAHASPEQNSEPQVLLEERVSAT